MKFSILVMFGILFGAYIILSVLDRSGEYVAEQLIWKANKKFNLVTRDPSATPANAFFSLEEEYRDVIKKFPSSPLAPKAMLTIGKLYVIKKDFAKAREKLQETLEKYPQDVALNAQAYSLIGKSYELEEDWENARNIYEHIRVKYPTTEIGLNVPIYILNYYEKNPGTVDLDQLHTETLAYYDKISKEYAGTLLEIKSLNMLANTYFLQKRWLEGVNTLGRALIRSSQLGQIGSPMVKTLIKSINNISVSQLKNYDLPIAIYQEYMRMSPKDELTLTLNELIRALSDLKKNNKEASPEE